MHRQAALFLSFVLAMGATHALAQPPMPEEPAPAEEIAEPPRPAIMRGRPLPVDEEWVVNQNTVERYALPQEKGFIGFYETPYSTRQEIADVRLVPPPMGQGVPNTIILETKDLLGTTEIVLPVLTGDGQKVEKRIELLVVDQISAAYRTYLQNQIKKIFPTAVVDVLIANSQTAVLNGYVERAEQVAPIENLVRGFLSAAVAQAPDSVTVVNALRVVGAQSVQLRVVIAEVQRSKVRDLGFDWNWFNRAENAWVQAASVATGSFGNRILGIGTNGAISGLSSTGTGSSNINFVLQRDGQVVFQGFIRALITNNLAKILAEPNLVTTSGQPAYFNVGGQVPVLTPQGNGTISITYRDFGTNLRFVPTVLGEGRVRIEVRPEVSELNFANGVVLNNIVVPGFNVRVAETTVEMEAGQTFVVAGLIQKRVIADTQKLPLLGDIPIAGAMFQDKSYRQDESEILIMVTPHLASALDQAPCELPGRESRIPNDVEYFLGSKFEPPCFNDPYRGHWQNWKNGGASPQAVPLRPYDNYGQPPGEMMIPGVGAPGTTPQEGVNPEADEQLVPSPVAPTEQPLSTALPETNYEVSYEGAGAIPADGSSEETVLVPPPPLSTTDGDFTPVARAPVSKPRTTWQRGGWTKAGSAK